MDCSPDNGPFSYFTKAVVLHKWWLVKPQNGEKGLAVAGHASKESQSVRLFSSAPIAKRFDLFTLQTTDGIDIILRGTICKIKSIDNGFPSEIINYFVLGFPPNWKDYTEGPFGAKTDTKFDSKEKENSSTYMLSPLKASQKYVKAIQDKHGDTADTVVKQESSEYNTRTIQEMHDDAPDMMPCRRIASSESNKKCNGSSSGYEDNVNPSAVHQVVSVVNGRQEELVSVAATVASPNSRSSQNPVNDITKSLTEQYVVKMVRNSSPEEEVDTGPNNMKGRRKDQKKAFPCQDHMNYKTSEQNSKSESVENPVEENSGQRENFKMTTNQSKGNERLKDCLGNNICEQKITWIALEELVSTASTITSPSIFNLSPLSGNDIMKSPTEQAGIKVVKNSLPVEEMNSVDAVSIKMKGRRKNQKRAFSCRGHKKHKKSEQKSKSKSLENPDEENSGRGDISVAIACQSKSKKRLKGCSGHNISEQKRTGIALESNSDSLTSNHKKKQKAVLKFQATRDLDQGDYLHLLWNFGVIKQQFMMRIVKLLALKKPLSNHQEEKMEQLSCYVNLAGKWNIGV